MKLSISLYKKMIPNESLPYFSGRLKHCNVLITGNSVTRKGSDSKSKSVGVLIQNSNFDSSKRIRFAIQNLNGDIAFGICVRKQAERQNFMANPSWVSLNHGHYVKWASNQVHLSNDQKRNHLHIGWALYDGDSIEIQFSHEHKLLKFTKNSDIQNILIVPNVQDRPAQDFSFCVYLWNSNDSVYIV